MHGRNRIKVEMSGGGARFRGTDQVTYINMLNIKCLLDVQVKMLRKQLNRRVWSSKGEFQPGDDKFQNQQQERWPSKP